MLCISSLLLFNFNWSLSMSSSCLLLIKANFSLSLSLSLVLSRLSFVSIKLSIFAFIIRPSFPIQRSTTLWLQLLHFIQKKLQHSHIPINTLLFIIADPPARSGELHGNIALFSFQITGRFKRSYILTWFFRVDQIINDSWISKQSSLFFWKFLKWNEISFLIIFYKYREWSH